MGLLLNNIAENGDSLHHKLEGLISERNYDAVNDEVNVHITSYDWRQPQLPLSEQTPLFFRALDARKSDEKTNLHNLETALKLDGDYHTTWNDLNMLKELWGRHRTTWRKHYRNFRDQRNDLLSLESEAKSVLPDTQDGFQAQMTLIVKAIDKETRWFEDSQLLEKTLM